MQVFSKERLLQDLPSCPKVDGIDPIDAADRLAKMAAIGVTPEGGITRYPYTEEEKQVKEVFRGWMESIGLEVYEDSIGNLFGRYLGEKPELPIVMTGSHLDTVPNGGAFDGALGCLSSLLALEALIKQGKKPKRTIELAVFVDEEGSRFENGLFGSRVMMGEVTVEQLENFSDAEGITLPEAMMAQGYQPNQIDLSRRLPEDIFAFLELHIEQGKILESEGKHIGIVNGIAGPSWRSFTFLGSTDHAGNTPMHLRKDTVAAAAEFISGVEKLPRTFSPTAVATVGKVNVFPNGTNVISGKTEVVVDARDIDEASRDQMLEAITSLAQEIARNREMEVEIEKGISIPPVKVPDWIQNKIAQAAERHGLSTRTLPSGAGHDAMIVGKYVPSGMIFVPSHQGKSHSPEEWTSLPDCMNGIQVLIDTLFELAND
ncbi:Zn-dependent hydrolase [Brevibacillus composti]|uniref:Zn-dependent hydrolase n=1 Tax=Brevibacillus composti TaxID=2796470 RepID=A0A7T5JPF1_9BACL|nr:Zn-dependent hydrolase [Brevibacillus composti]QQE75092.1 Zn-dependent hydrolase [Brevibacillus composti]QUO42179.1 Zn-dependent hydrolase [Brevibacillus composti]